MKVEWTQEKGRNAYCFRISHREAVITGTIEYRASPSHRYGHWSGMWNVMSQGGWVPKIVNPSSDDRAFYIPLEDNEVTPFGNGFAPIPENMDRAKELVLAAVARGLDKHVFAVSADLDVLSALSRKLKEES